MSLKQGVLVMLTLLGLGALVFVTAKVVTMPGGPCNPVEAQR
jgi:hypothetical protein